METSEALNNTDRADYFETFYQSSPIGFFTCDERGKLIRANSAFSKILGLEEKEPVSKPVTLHFIDKDTTAFTDLLHELLAVNVAAEKSIICKTLDHKKVKFILTPLIVDGKTIAINGIARDITTQLLEGKIHQKNESRIKIVLRNLKRILASSLDIICTLDEKGAFTNVSAASYTILGYQPKELIGKNFLNFVHRDDIEKSVIVTKEQLTGIPTTSFENRFYRKDGSIVYLNWSSKWDETDKKFYSIARDATDMKSREAALAASEEKYKILFQHHPLPSWIYNIDTLNFLEVNTAALQHYSYTREEFLKLKLSDIIVEEEASRFKNIKSKDTYYTETYKGIWLHRKKDRSTFYAEITSNYTNFNGHHAKLVLAIDRTEKIKAEQELITSNERYLFLSEATFDAIWDWDLRTGEIQWNDGVREMFGVTNVAEIAKIDWWSSCLHPDDKERVLAKLNGCIATCNSNWEDEYRFRRTDGTYRYIFDRGYMVFDDYNKPLRMIGAMQDLTERKAHEELLEQLNQSLEKRAAELANSNEELERFAYVASHDLQEPLRMVTSFLQLLEKRYKDKLDEKAHQYIHFAVDGAERMKRLILDLLEFSRVNTSVLEKEVVDTNEILKELKLTYKSVLTKTGGTINYQTLPLVKGAKTQILQLFQNLVSNALKYRKDIAPTIIIQAKEEGAFYEFSVADNGIGINPKFFNKIFIIFQRLHNREQYSGTGIGLAICKKIIDRHGGKIWLTSTPGEGSTFYFTLPKTE